MRRMINNSFFCLCWEIGAALLLTIAAKICSHILDHDLATAVAAAMGLKVLVLFIVANAFLVRAVESFK